MSHYRDTANPSKPSVALTAANVPHKPGGKSEAEPAPLNHPNHNRVSHRRNLGDLIPYTTTITTGTPHTNKDTSPSTTTGNSGPTSTRI